MARRIKVEAGALNVRLHPHDDDTYVRFLRAIYRAKQPIKLRGERTAVIRSLSTKPDADGLLQGMIATYLSIDVDQPWFNEETSEEATGVELEDVSLPRHLHPNVNSFIFFLDVKAHRIYFEHYSQGKVFTHNSALTFFEGSAGIPAISKEFGGAKITIVQSKLALDKVFGLERITEVTVYIEKPNDVWPDSFEEHLDKKNARSMSVQYRAEQGLGIIKDHELQELAEASLDNGYTEVGGYGPSGHQVISTRSFPKVEQQKFPQDELTDAAMLKSVIDLFKRNK